jgi:hypothetical protein
LIGAAGQRYARSVKDQAFQTMVTLRDLLRVLAVFTGPSVGFMIGRDHGGIGSGIAYAIASLVLCLLIVEIPYRFFEYLDRRRLQRTATEVLIASLEHDARHFGRLHILRELKHRGHDIDFELPRLVDFLGSTSVIERAVGCVAIREFFPQISPQLSDYKPFQESSASSPAVTKLALQFPPAVT